ncbi:DnaJ family domain-containing protein [Virgibacillus siamensis]|uniref:DnaJ family domain-containing protein n=1 Tax=Virgibacillus siamensis TaxID=480071 RepID=UPI000985C4D2|nr:DUF1992 domain-containing protein [Virgibacillus siamensis]
MSEKHNDFIGDMMRENQDDYNNLPGKGKPLPKENLQMDTFQRFQKTAKDAGFLPPWLKLQKEIASLLKTAKTEKDLEDINSKIKKHNRICPIPMQKNLVSFVNLEKAKDNWSE